MIKNKSCLITLCLARTFVFPLAMRMSCVRMRADLCAISAYADDALRKKSTTAMRISAYAHVPHTSTTSATAWTTLDYLVITITAVLKILHSQTRPWPCWSTHCQFSLVGWPTSTTTSSKVTDKDRGKGQRQKQTKTVLRGDQLLLKPAPRWHRCWNSGDDFDELFDMYFNRNKLGRYYLYFFNFFISGPTFCFGK